MRIRLPHDSPRHDTARFAPDSAGCYGATFFGSASYSHHVGIYAGGGQTIHAPHAGAVVSYGPISGAWIGGRF